MLNFAHVYFASGALLWLGYMWFLERRGVRAQGYHFLFMIVMLVPMTFSGPIGIIFIVVFWLLEDMNLKGES